MAEFLEADAASAKRGFRRRWLQFGFATLLKLVAVAAVLSAWWADRERLTERIGRLESEQRVLWFAMEEVPITRRLIIRPTIQRSGRT